ncbi:zinc ribbon domain-containing protein [Candidatus Bathyarchaeota archaeon]|nr:zinc ribbon domain-containing protein [Candidatus Bathyarchaeota archaeon]MBS7631691.1 zinc ribbon domain-containing protein [Candidatus Bathyarchaeota archaeon]
MQEDIQEEVVHCPNCREEVPKTLYCLNCGHPLYKETSLMEEAPKQEVKPEPEAYVEPDEIHLEPEAEEEVFEPLIEEPMEEVKVDDMIVENPPTELNQMNLPEPTEKREEEHPTLAEEMVPEVYLDEDKALKHEVPEVAQEEVVQEEAESSEPVQAEEESKAIEEKPAEVVQEPQTVKVEEMSKTSEESLWKYEPDPLVQEILQNIAKNISLKIKLSKLMLDGSLKESTFLKLLEKYSAQGERWISRRNEIIERDRYDIDSMEKALEEAKIAMDELEIRKAIGDATEDEYSAKMPAYKWEVNSFAEKIRKSKGEVEYLSNISSMLPVEEIQELESLIKLCYASINNSEGSKVSDTIKLRVKEVLDESLELVKESP